MMEYTVVIRDYRPGDERECLDVITEGTMSTVNTSFFSGLTRELTFQLIVLTAALLFIFFGVPFSYCLLAIPIVVVLMYTCIWLCHSYKAMELAQDIMNIPRIYMSSNLTGFWVAEVSEPLLPETAQTHYTILSARELTSSPVPEQTCRKRVVGTIAVAQSRQSEGSGWIRRLAVASRYRRKGIASALVDEAVRFCQEHGYTSVEVVTSEYHDSARELFHKKNFELKQIYHRAIVGSLVAVCMYELSHKIKFNKISAEP